MRLIRYVLLSLQLMLPLLNTNAAIAASNAADVDFAADGNVLQQQPITTNSNANRTASSVDIDLNTVVNVISNEFVSFAIDPMQMLALRQQPQ